MKRIVVIAFAFSLIGVQAALARRLIGTEGGNGGDLCEKRIYDIKNDILSWIAKGGAQGFIFAPPMDLSTYVSKMSESLSNARVSCVDETLKIGESEKTCINLIGENKPQIICNLKRFSAIADADQYVLVHHEYAGLAGLEKNDGEVSHYEISNQLTGFLTQTVVTRLAVKPATSNVSLPDRYLRDSFSDQFLKILSVHLLPMTCDYSKIQKSLHASDFTYSYSYIGETGPCIRANATNFPFYKRFISLRMQTDYIVDRARNQDLGPHNIVNFAGKVSYPTDVHIQETQAREVARQIWNLLAHEARPDVQVSRNPAGGLTLKMEATQNGVTFSLVIEVNYVNEGLPSDQDRPVLKVVYQTFA